MEDSTASDGGGGSVPISDPGNSGSFQSRGSDSANSELSGESGVDGSARTHGPGATGSVRNHSSGSTRSVPISGPGNPGTPRSGNFFPPGLTVRAVQPIDNDAVRSLFIAVQGELAPPGADPKLRTTIKRYTDSCLNDDLARASVHYTKSRRRMWVLESQEREIVAMVAVDGNENEQNVSMLRRLAVAQQFRRKGVARLLVQRTEQWASKQGYGSMRLYVTELQPEARSLYETLGYSEMQASNYGPIAVFEMEKALPAGSN